MRKILMSLMLIVFITGCTPAEAPVSGTGNVLDVYATFYPLGYFAQEIGKGVFDVEVITPTGVEPHEYSPSPKTLEAIYQADLLVYQGSGFEPWMENMKGSLSSADVILFSGSSVVELLTPSGQTPEPEHAASKSEYEEGDPHTWVDPVRMIDVVDALTTQLSALKPSFKETFEANAADLKARLLALDAEYKLGLQNCSKNTIVVSHNAFNYLGNRYGFNIKAVSGLSPHDEPSLNELVALKNFIDTEGVEYIFLETLASPELIETLAKETGVGVLTLNPLEGLTTEEAAAGENYFTLMKANLESLQVALACSGV